MTLLADLTSMLDKLEPVLAISLIGNGVQWWWGQKKDAATNGMILGLTVTVNRLADKLGIGPKA